MKKIHKIVTARNTIFIERFPMDGAENSPIVTDINPVSGEGVVDYEVVYSNGVSVYVKDVVEVWDRPATSDEEKAIMGKWALAA